MPNVMTCMTPAREGMTVDTQNTLGSREVDFLRVTDWFFPQGINHHELLAGVPGLDTIMQGFARRVAGLGKLPEAIRAPAPSRRRNVDVLVVGAGPAGMAVATAMAQKGRVVEVVDDALDIGGCAVQLPGADWRAIESAFAAEQAKGSVTVRTRTVVGGIFKADVLVASTDEAEMLEPRELIVATGAHDGVLAFEGNDLPGVMSARAAGWLLCRGIALGPKVVVVVPPGGGPFGQVYADALRARDPGSEVHLVFGEPVQAVGNLRVKRITVRERGQPERTLAADAVLIDAPRAPSYELCEQAGATLVHELRGFVPQTIDGKVRDGVWAIGEVAGMPLDPGLIRERAARIAAQI